MDRAIIHVNVADFAVAAAAAEHDAEHGLTVIALFSKYGALTLYGKRTALTIDPADPVELPLTPH